MPKLITLEHFHASHRHYHIYRLKNSSASKEPHYHNYFQVCFVIRGEIYHKQGNESVTLRAGDAFIVPPGFVHSLLFGKNTEIYSLCFDDLLFHPGFPHSNAFAFLKDIQEAALHKKVRLRVTLDLSPRKSVLSLLACLLRQQQSTCPAELSAAPSLVAAVLQILAQSYYAQTPGDLSLSETNQVLAQCLAYVNENYRQPLNAADLAKKFGFSRSSFCSIFPRFAGMPLQKYIANKRIAEAQFLIRSHPHWQLSYIAQAVGYTDDSTFYRNFIKICGMSPAKYRTMWSE